MNMTLEGAIAHLIGFWRNEQINVESFWWLKLTKVHTHQETLIFVSASMLLVRAFV